MYANKHK